MFFVELGQDLSSHGITMTNLVSKQLITALQRGKQSPGGDDELGHDSGSGGSLSHIMLTCSHVGETNFPECRKERNVNAASIPILSPPSPNAFWYFKETISIIKH